MSTSILNKKHISTERPYSHKELNFLRKQFFYSLRIGKLLIEHQDCRHSYYARLNGKKEREAIESNMTNIGNCSVCWKLNRTPKSLKKQAKNLIDKYLYLFYSSDLDVYEKLETEQDFYTWLYCEFNEGNKK